MSPETGKADCLIVDIVDNVGRANGMLVSPTLFGLTHDELAEEEREREEARANGEGMMSPFIEITVLTSQKSPHRRSPKKVHRGSAKLPLSMRMTPSDLCHSLDRPWPRCHQTHG